MKKLANHIMKLLSVKMGNIILFMYLEKRLHIKIYIYTVFKFAINVIIQLMLLILS